MIAFHCQCGNVIQTPDGNAGKRGKCRKCGQVVTVPSKPVLERAGADSAGHSPVGRSQRHSAAVQEQPSGLSSETKIIIGGIGILAAIVVGFSVWFFAIRDTWESDHRDDVLRLSEETVTLSQANNPDGVKKYDELLRLVGKRTFTDAKLTKAVVDARDAAEPAKKKILEEQRLAEQRQKEAEVISKLGSLESQAKAFVDAGDFARGIEKYQQALDLIKDSQSSNAELAASVGRISQAKALAVTKLDAKRQEEETERKRIEEEKRMASVIGNVKGGAWITRKSGSSELARGLEVYLLRDGKVDAALVRAQFERNLARLNSDCKQARNDYLQEKSRNDQKARETPDYPPYRGLEDLHKEVAGKLEALIKLRTEEMQQLKPRVTVSEAYECIKDAASYYGDPDFSEILTTLNPKSTHADSDGKYTFEGVAGGGTSSMLN